MVALSALKPPVLINPVTAMVLNCGSLVKAARGALRDSNEQISDIFFIDCIVPHPFFFRLAHIVARVILLVNRDSLAVVFFSCKWRMECAIVDARFIKNKEN
jgi:hypothetical protein